MHHHGESTLQDLHRTFQGLGHEFWEQLITKQNVGELSMKEAAKINNLNQLITQYFKSPPQGPSFEVDILVTNHCKEAEFALRALMQEKKKAGVDDPFYDQLIVLYDELVDFLGPDRLAETSVPSR